MLYSILKSAAVFLLILIGFILILLLPREQEIAVFSAFHVEADYPFSFELYKERIQDFTVYIVTEKGLGDARSGRPVSEESAIFVKRSIKIILPAFMVSMLLGTLMGALQFYRRKNFPGSFRTFFPGCFLPYPIFSFYCHSIPSDSVDAARASLL
ncbi:hypothetical protein M5V91_01755 [Cytobacillus pseudoceanisediminis]|uniref:hypothetical protein n=1 Tax=Cytobacillus pseudoceanisediminis TaxID=3051614 RepID=UPI00218C40EB|nr:hypothetical protein [Cytobacillus pseudoceanisediminis]UQX54615.1 hypothetical protein M5V91_01755 [Cytobacillus pseudoceanisediminis]